MKMSKKYMIDKKLERFKKSKFRSSFHLSNKNKEYVLEKGYPIIKLHAIDFLTFCSKKSLTSKVGDELRLLMLE